MTVPAAGSPVAENGAAGGVTAETVSLAVPPLVMVTLTGIVVPSGTDPKLAEPGVAYRPGLVPWPVRLTGTAGKFAEFVANCTEPVTPPGAVGVNVTGTVRVCPAVSVTGSVTGFPLRVAVPAANGPPGAGVVVIAEIVTLVDAVTETSWAGAVLPTGTGPKFTGVAPVSGALSGLLNASTRPSLVPTYTMPLLVAGIVNLVTVPIGVDQIGLIVHGAELAQLAGGTASNASSRPPAPDSPEE